MGILPPINANIYKTTRKDEWFETYTKEQFCVEFLGGLELEEVQEILKKAKPENFI